MVSEGLGGALPSVYLWCGAVALFAGAALGQAIRALAPDRGPSARRSRPPRARRSGRWARSIAFLALSILFAAGALVVPEKSALGDPILPLWCACLGAMGALAGIWPRAAGFPLLAASAACLLGVGAGLRGWLPYRGPSTIARLLPFEVTAAASGAPATGGALAAGASGSFVGELEAAERDSVPVAQRVELASDSASLVVETLSLGGPLGFAASIVRPGAKAGRYYRIVGVASGAAGGAGGDASAEALGGLLRRTRAASAELALHPLEPILFALGEGPVPEARAGQ